MVSFEENEKLVMATYHRYFAKINKHKDDLMQCGNLGLWKACLKYDETKGVKFSTFAVRCIKNEMAQFLRKELKHWYYCTDYVITGDDGDKIDILEIMGDEKDFEEFDSEDYIDRALQVKNGDIVKKWITGKTHKEIGAEYGVTHQRINEIIKKTIGKVKERIE